MFKVRARFFGIFMETRSVIAPQRDGQCILSV